MPSNLLSTWLKYAIFIVAAGLFAVVARAQPVNAASTSIMPNPADFTAGTAVHMEVSRIGLGNGLDAPQSNVRLYFPPSSGGSGSISILHADHCTGSGIDSNVYAPTQYVVYPVNAGDGTVWSPIAVYNTPGPNPSGCGGYRTLTFSGLTASAVNGGYRGWYVAEFYATHTGSAGGVNGFQMRANTAGGRIGFSKGSTSKFALQDRVNATGTFSHFTMTFAPDCTLTGPASPLLEWFDDDWGGIQTNSNYYTELVEYNSGGAVTSRVRIDPRQGNDQPGSARVTIRPGHRYAWTWYNVAKANGIQFLMPYDSINYDLPCPPQNTPPTITATASCTAITGTARDANGLTTVQAGVKVGTGGAIQVLQQGGRNGAFSITIPNNLKSGFNPTIVEWVRVIDVGPGAGGPVYASGFGNTNDNVRSLGNCGTVWNYTINMTGPADTATGPKPGTSLTFNSTVTNVGNGGPGANYEQRFVVLSGANNLVSSALIRYSGQPGLARNAGRTRNATYQIAPTATHGATVCFQAWVAPFMGQATPTLTTTSTGWRVSSPPLCYTIYNLRFDLNLTISMPSTAYPTQPITIQYNVCNQTEDELNLISPAPGTATRGPSAPTTLTTSGNLAPSLSNATNLTVNNSQCISRSGNVTIPSSAIVGDTLCTRVNSSRNAGYSDRTGFALEPETADACLTIYDAPYLKAYGNDAWAGFNFNNGTNCTPSGRGKVESNTRASVGASDEYAVFAYNIIDSFGSANSPLSDLMKFANTNTPRGNFGADRCVNDYFSLLNPYAAPSPGSVTGLINGNNPDDGQYVYNNTQSTGGTNNYRKQQTILIDGDLILTGNIAYTNSYNQDDIPILIFVVRGNIVIRPGVTRLDGIYIAQPRADGSRGIIDTCSNNNIVGDNEPLGAPAAGNGLCDRQLTVNGTFVAQNIHFRRTYGGLNEAATGNNVARRCFNSATPEGGNNDERCAAEVFRFSPEVYLAQPFFNTGQTRDDMRILQLRDLPPIF